MRESNEAAIIDDEELFDVVVSFFSVRSGQNVFRKSSGMKWNLPNVESIIQAIDNYLEAYEDEDT